MAYTNVLLFTLVLVGACAESSPNASSRVQLREDVGPAFGLAWVNDDLLAMNRTVAEESGPGPFADLWTFDLEAERLQPVELPPSAADCSATEYLNPTRLSNDRVILSTWCHSKDFDARLDVINVVALSLETGQVEPLVTTSLPFNPAGIAWHDGQGLVTANSGFCAGIARLTPDGVEPWDVALDRLRVDEGFFSQASDCSQELRAAMPTITSDGRIAFFASPDSVGVSGSARLETPWAIYVIERGGEPDPLPAEVRFPESLSWSPSGRSLAFSGVVEGEEGTWLVSWPDGQVTRVSGETAHWLDWAPDGSRIAALTDAGSPEDGPRTTQLVIFRVAEV